MKEVRVLCDRAGNATVYLDRHIGVNVGLGAPLELPQLFIPRIGIYLERARPHRKHAYGNYCILPELAKCGDCVYQQVFVVLTWMLAMMLVHTHTYLETWQER